MDWGDDDDAFGGGAGDFLAQLEAEQYQHGISTVNLGAFEGAEDELALSDDSSGEELDEDDDIAPEELLDLDDDEILDKMSTIQRITNRFSKPRYLRNYFMGAMAAQLLLYIALFISQATMGNGEQTVGLIVVATMLLAGQAAQGTLKMIAATSWLLCSTEDRVRGAGKKHFSQKATSSVDIDYTTKSLVEMMETSTKLDDRLKWHSKMIHCEWRRG